MTPKESLVLKLHESRDHARDGSPLDGFLCNCREYIETLWPEIDAMRDQAFEAGWEGRADTLEGNLAELRESILCMILEAINKLTFWRRKP